MPALFGLVKELAEFEKGLDKVTNTLEQMQEEKDFFQCYVAEKDNEVVKVVHNEKGAFQLLSLFFLFQIKFDI